MPRVIAYRGGGEEKPRACQRDGGVLKLSNSGECHTVWECTTMTLRWEKVPSQDDQSVVSIVLLRSSVIHETNKPRADERKSWNSCGNFLGCSLARGPRTGGGGGAFAMMRRRRPLGCTIRNKASHLTVVVVLASQNLFSIPRLASKSSKLDCLERLWLVREMGGRSDAYLVVADDVGCCGCGK